MLSSIHNKWPSRIMHAFPARVLVKIEAINPKKMIEVDFILSSNKILTKSYLPSHSNDVTFYEYYSTVENLNYLRVYTVCIYMYVLDTSV